MKYHDYIYHGTPYFKLPNSNCWESAGFLTIQFKAVSDAQALGYLKKQLKRKINDSLGTMSVYNENLIKIDISKSDLDMILEEQIKLTPSSKVTDESSNDFDGIQTTIFDYLI